QARFTAELSAAQKEYEDTTMAVTRRQEQDHTTLTREYAAARYQAGEVYDREKGKAEAEYKEAQWATGAVYESARQVGKEALVTVQRTVGTAMQEIQSARQEAAQLLARWGMEEPEPDDVPARAAPASIKELLKAIQQGAASARAQAAQLGKLKLPGYL